MTKFNEINGLKYIIRKFEDLSNGSIFLYAKTDLWMKTYLHDNTNGYKLCDGSPGLFDNDDDVVLVTNIDYVLEKE